MEIGKKHCHYRADGTFAATKSTLHRIRGISKRQDFGE
jgi:hypothetical protein